MAFDDPKYPQYGVSVRWKYNNKDGKRADNSVYLHLMFKEDPGSDGVATLIQNEWWPQFRENRPIGTDGASLPDWDITQQPDETWCLGWFQHWTFDVGQSDGEALASFDAFVGRYRHMQDRADEFPGVYRLLMGAEDRWRWGKNSNDGKTVCRCKSCVKQGKIRIDH